MTEESECITKLYKGIQESSGGSLLEEQGEL